MLSRQGDRAAARDLYEESLRRIEERAARLDADEKGRDEREAKLVAAERDLVTREKEVRILEEQVEALRQQQLGLHRTIATLTGRIEAAFSDEGGEGEAVAETSPGLSSTA